MKIFEIILLGLAVIAAVLFFIPVPGGAYLTTIVLSVLSTFYFLFGFIFFSKVEMRAVFKGGFKDVSGATIAISIITGIALSIIITGILFKLLMFPGSANMLFTGAILAIVLIVISLVRFIRTRSASSKLTLSRLNGFFILAVVLLFTSTLSIVKFQYRNHPAYVEAYVNYTNEPENPNYQEALETEYRKMMMGETPN